MLCRRKFLPSKTKMNKRKLNRQKCWQKFQLISPGRRKQWRSFRSSLWRYTCHHYSHYDVARRRAREWRHCRPHWSWWTRFEGGLLSGPQNWTGSWTGKSLPCRPWCHWTRTLNLLNVEFVRVAVNDSVFARVCVFWARKKVLNVSKRAAPFLFNKCN